MQTLEPDSAPPPPEVAAGPAGLEALAAMPGRAKLESHYLLHAVTGELHWRLRNEHEAVESFRRALEFAHVGPEQAFLARLAGRTDPTGELSRHC